MKKYVWYVLIPYGLCIEEKKIIQFEVGGNPNKSAIE